MERGVKSSTLASDPLDPIARSRRATTRVAAATLTFIAVCGVWALWPQSTASIDVTASPQPIAEPAEASPAPTESAAPFDLAAFNAPLWINPPKPVVAKAEPPAPPPPPMRAQLLAITNGGTGGELHRAIFYDQDKDTLVTVGVGDMVVGRSVVAVDAAGVTLSQGTKTQRLDLRLDQEHRPLGATAAEDLAALMGRTLSTERANTDPMGGGPRP